MSVGDLVRAVIKFLDGGLVLRYCGLVHRVHDLGLGDGTISILLELVLRQRVECPCPVGINCSSGGVFLSTVSVQDDLNAGRTDLVFIVSVSPFLDAAYVYVLRSMSVGDLVRAVIEQLDGGLVLRHRALVNSVNDQSLGDFAGGSVKRIVIFRKLCEAPRPVAHLRSGGGGFLNAVGVQDNGHAVGTDLVLVVRVRPLLDTVHVDVFGRMGVGDDVTGGHIAGNNFGVLAGNEDLIPGVGDQGAVRHILGQVLSRVGPVVVRVQSGGHADEAGFIGIQLHGDGRRSDVVFVVVVFPDLLDCDFGLFGVDHVVAFFRIRGDVAGYRILNDGINDLGVSAVGLFILVEVGEAPRPVVRRSRDHELAGVNAVSVQMHGDGVGTGVVLVVVVDPDLLAGDIDDGLVGDLPAVEHDTVNSDRVGLRVRTYVTADRVLGNGVLDLVRSDLLRSAHAVLAQVLEGVRPVARRRTGDLNGLGQNTVGVQINNDRTGSDVTLVVIVFPDLLDRNVDVRRNVGVDDFDIAVFMLDVFGIVTVHDIFFERVVDLVAALVELRQILKAPLPVIGRGNDDAVHLRGARHQVDGDADRTDAAVVVVVVPGLEAVLGDNGRSVGEGDGRVFVLFDRLLGGGEGNVRNRIVPFGGGNVFIGLYGVAGNKFAAGFGHGVLRAFGQIRERGGLAAHELKLNKACAARKSDERVLGVSYTIIICSIGSQVGEDNVEREFGGVVRVRAFEHLGYLEAALRRFDLGVGDLRSDGRGVAVRGGPGCLSGLVGVADLKFFDDSFFNLVVQIGIGNACPGRGSNSRKTGDIYGLAAFDHERRADAVLKVHVAVQTGNVCRYLRERAVGVQCHGNGELAVKVFLLERSAGSGLQLFFDLQFGRRRIDFVVGHGYERGSTCFAERAFTVRDRDGVAIRIRLGDDVGNAHRQIGQSDLVTVFDKDVGLAVLQRYVAVSAVESGVVKRDMDRELLVRIAVVGNDFLDRKAGGLRRSLGVRDLHGVLAVSEVNESLVRVVCGSSGLDGAAGFVNDRDGVVNARVGFPAGHRAFPEVVSRVNVVHFEGVAPGAVAVIDPLSRIADLADKSGICGTAVFAAFALIIVRHDLSGTRKSVQLCVRTRKSVAVVRHRIGRDRRDCRRVLLCKVAGQRRVGRERAVVYAVCVSVVMKERTAREHQVARRSAAAVGRTYESIFIRPFGACPDGLENITI